MSSSPNTATIAASVVILGLAAIGSKSFERFDEKKNAWSSEALV
jgi:hypothetical protein